MPTAPPATPAAPTLRRSTPPATGKPLTALYRVNGAIGDLKFTREIPQPGPTDNWSITQHLLPTGDTVSLLASDANHAVTLSAYNAANQPRWKTATPLTAPAGRLNSLHAPPTRRSRGHRQLRLSALRSCR